MAFMNSDGSALIGGELPSGAGQALQLDASGNLKMTGAAGINLNQINGAGLTPSNPVLIENNIQTWIRLGQGFNGTSGAQSTAGAVNSVAFSLFNPAASGKNVYLFSLKVMANLASIFALLNLVTSDPGLTAAQVNNLSIGGAAPAAHTTYSNTAQTPTGTTIDRLIVPSNLMMSDFFANGAGILLPSGAANGIVVYLNLTAAANWTITGRWVEF